MRKLFLLPFLAMACVFMSGCTSDYEFEDGQSAKEQKALEVKAKIQELAEDYGLNAQIGGEIQPEEVDSIDLNKVEAVFKAIASSMGRYDMSCGKTGQGNVEATQVSDKKKRVKRLSRAQETYENYECYFADETGNREQRLYTVDGVFICTCKASWSTEGDIAKTASISPEVRLIDPIVYSYGLASCDYSWEHIGGAGIRFDGKLTEEIYWTHRFYTTVDIKFIGNCDPTGGSITWY